MREQEDSGLPDGIKTGNDLDALFRSGKAEAVLNAPTLAELRIRPFYIEANRQILMDCFENTFPVGTIEQEAERLLVVARELVEVHFTELMFASEPRCVEIAARLREASPLTLADAARRTFVEEAAQGQRDGEMVRNWGLLVNITEEAVRQWQHNPGVFRPVK